MDTFGVITLFGGLAMFLYGMRIMGNGLKEGSSGALKVAIESVTNNPVKAFLMGLVMTAVIQSSTATIVITSGLVGAGILSLHQSIGIIVGANVGTTVTGQIIRLLDVDSGASAWLKLFQPSTLAPAALIIGIIILMSGKVKNGDLIGSILMGFGILFSGLLNMTGAVNALSETGAFDSLFNNLSANPLLGYLIGVAVSFILQSSSATIGILQTFSMTGGLSFSSVYAVIAGVYLGDCVTTAIVCSIGASSESKRVGVVHILFNLCKTVAIFAAIAVCRGFGLLDGIWSAPINSGGIADANTLFNLLSAVILFPLLGLFEKSAVKIVKDKPAERFEYAELIESLNPSFFKTPAIAFKGCQEVLNRMISIAIDNFHRAVELFDDYDDEKFALVEKEEKALDRLADSINAYMVQLSPYLGTEGYIKTFDEYVKSIGEFERLGDHAENIAESAKALHESKHKFSAIALTELTVATDLAGEVLEMAGKAFRDNDYEVAKKIEPLEEACDDLIAELNERHVARLRKGDCDVEAATVFLDILTDLERISDRCSNTGLAVLSRAGSETIQPHEYTKYLHHGNDEWFNNEYYGNHDRYFGRLDDAAVIAKKKAEEDKEESGKKSDSKKKGDKKKEDKKKDKSKDKSKDKKKEDKKEDRKKDKSKDK